MVAVRDVPADRVRVSAWCPACGDTEADGLLRCLRCGSATPKESAGRPHVVDAAEAPTASRVVDVPSRVTTPAVPDAMTLPDCAASRTLVAAVADVLATLDREVDEGIAGFEAWKRDVEAEAARRRAEVKELVAARDAIRARLGTLTVSTERALPEPPAPTPPPAEPVAPTRPRVQLGPNHPDVDAGQGWPARFRNGCVDCHTTEERHVGRGRCAACFERRYGRRQNGQTS